ncbi:manganese catalase family protein [Hephaestia mangrovi]|uniref:manganese catalase family protein n=1 Tax=Hephaestia mangrovi TaxID=2873268 RepID=UPI001CA6785B|nr:manganese catalase family protein [Hephaestia mangrovi]MBY8829821.1 manganese catalase family protein [Hephaestia mangrovi]
MGDALRNCRPRAGVRGRISQESFAMFIHKKELLHPVHVTSPDPKFAEFLLDAFGGATGELKASLQYFTQAQHTDDPQLRDMLMDIATEEMGHLEIVAHLIEAHSSGAVEEKAFESTLFSIRGKGPHLLDSQGTTWTGAYVDEGASPVRDLRADIAAEAGALASYEAMIPKSPDEGTRKALIHLATREVTHSRMFMEALKSMDKLDDPMFGDLQPDDTVNLVFNLSQTENPKKDGAAPWLLANSKLEYIADPEERRRTAKAQ